MTASLTAPTRSWNHAGPARASPRFPEVSRFIEDVVQRAEQHLCQVALVRMDAGFPSEHLMQVGQ